MSDMHKSYLKAIEAYYKKNRVYFERYRKAKELSYFEKRLLEAKAIYSKGNWKESQELLSSMTPSEDHFLNGEYYHLVALTSWLMNKRAKAIKYW